jgi:hypothetical protein
MGTAFYLLSLLLMLKEQQLRIKYLNLYSIHKTGRYAGKDPKELGWNVGYTD